MVEYDPVNKSSGLKNAIKCAENVLLDRIVSANDGYVGICFYNTRQRRNPSDFDSVYVYADLDVPDPQTIIGLEDIVSSPDPLPPFCSNSISGASNGMSPPSSTAGFAELTDALWTCSTMFSGARTAAIKAGSRVVSQRVFLFTNNNSPFPGGISSSSNNNSNDNASDLMIDSDGMPGGSYPSFSPSSSSQPASFPLSSSSSSSSSISGNPEIFRARERCLQKAKDLAGFGVKIELFAMEKNMVRSTSSSSSNNSHGCSIVDDNNSSLDDIDKGYGDDEIERSTTTGAKIDEKLAGVQGTRFPPDAFYCKLLVANGDTAAKDGVSSIGRMRDLKERAWCKEFRKRALARVPLVIGPDSSSSSDDSDGDGRGAAPEIGVQLYALCRRAVKGSARTLDAATNQEVVSDPQWVCKETGEHVFPSQVRFAYSYGGEQVAFTAEEVRRLRTLADSRGPCIRVLGFKAAAAVKPYMNAKTSIFVYPDEQMVKGSTVAFTALLEQMVALDRVAIACYTSRTTGAPALVALIPYIGAAAAAAPDTGVEQPSGLHMVYLPYAEDIRGVQPQGDTDLDNGGVGVEEASKDLAKRVVRLLNIDFSSRDFPNPTLQRHYAYLKACALKTDMDAVPDLVVPDREGMSRHAAAVQALAAAVYPPGYVPCLSTTRANPSKRFVEASGEDGAPKAKRMRADSLALQIDWVAAVCEGSVGKAKVKDLRDFLFIHGVKIPPKAKKEELLALVIEYVGDHKDELNNEPAYVP